MIFDYSIIPEHIRINKATPRTWRGVPKYDGQENRGELLEIRQLEKSGVILVDNLTRIAVARENYFIRKREEKQNGH